MLTLVLELFAASKSKLPPLPLASSSSKLISCSSNQFPGDSSFEDLYTALSLSLESQAVASRDHPVAKEPRLSYQEEFLKTAAI